MPTVGGDVGLVGENPALEPLARFELVVGPILLLHYEPYHFGWPAAKHDAYRRFRCEQDAETRSLASLISFLDHDFILA